MHHASTSTYTPNFLEIKETFCGRTDVRTFETYFIKSTQMSRIWVDLIKQESASTHKSAKSHAGHIFVTRGLDLSPQNKLVFRTPRGTFLCQIWWSQLHGWIFFRYRAERQKTNRRIKPFMRYRANNMSCRTNGQTNKLDSPKTQCIYWHCSIKPAGPHRATKEQLNIPLSGVQCNRRLMHSCSSLETVTCNKLSTPPSLTIPFCHQHSSSCIHFAECY